MICDIFGGNSITVYTCKRNLIGGGIAVSNSIGPTEENIIFAQLYVDECNEAARRIEGKSSKENIDCPGDCGLRNLASRMFWYNGERK